MIGDNCIIGPYGRVRTDVSIGNYVSTDNFVEVKNANIASKWRINHLSFIGDVDLEEQVIIGAGTITCNHDEVGINHTIIEEGCTLFLAMSWWHL